MIIIKIIILYFIQIRHTDDFPSTRTRLVLNKCSSTRLNPCSVNNNTETSINKVEPIRISDITIFFILFPEHCFPG